jgi:hypothetical protein
MILPNLDGIVYQRLKTIANIYAYTCDIKHIVKTTGGDGLPDTATNTISANVPCLLVPMETKKNEPNTSVAGERYFTLHLIDSPLILDNYHFTNFSQDNLPYPDGIYQVGRGGKIKPVASSGNSYAYLIEGVKLVNNNA